MHCRACLSCAKARQMLRCRCWTAPSSWTRLTNFLWSPAVAVWSKHYNLSAKNCLHSATGCDSDCTVTQVRLERAEEGRVDAAAALNMEPGSSRAILALGEALYCLGQAQHRNFIATAQSISINSFLLSPFIAERQIIFSDSVQFERGLVQFQRLATVEQI